MYSFINFENRWTRYDPSGTIPKIAISSTSLGMGPSMKGFDSVRASIERAENAGITTLYVGSRPFLGAGRAPLANPDDPASYRAAQYWRRQLQPSRKLLIPMDSPATASSTGPDDYAFYRSGGASWTVPYVAGLYALALQVTPTITFDHFWETLDRTAAPALQSGITIGRIINPAAMINAVRQLRRGSTQAQ